MLFDDCSCALRWGLREYPILRQNHQCLPFGLELILRWWLFQSGCIKDNLNCYYCDIRLNAAACDDESFLRPILVHGLIPRRNIHLNWCFPPKCLVLDARKTNNFSSFADPPHYEGVLYCFLSLWVLQNSLSFKGGKRHGLPLLVRDLHTRFFFFNNDLTSSMSKSPSPSWSKRVNNGLYTKGIRGVDRPPPKP